MSDQLSPGSFASLTRNENRAFRADFPDGNVPPLSQLYWRGAVLWRGDGMSWARGSSSMPRWKVTRGNSAARRCGKASSSIRTGARWLFALDRPAVAARDSEFLAGGFLQSTRPIFRNAALHRRLAAGKSRGQPARRPSRRVADKTAADLRAGKGAR